MVTPTYPGVYVQEVSSGVSPIESAGTSTAAFIGIAEKGRLNVPLKIYNFTEYQKEYGGFLKDYYLTHSVYQFFNNGGSQCYVIRIGGQPLNPARVALKDRQESNQQNNVSSQISLTISAKSDGLWGNQLAFEVEAGTNDPNNEFNLLVYQVNSETSTPEDASSATLLERFENLSMIPNSPNYVETVTASSNQIRVKVNNSNQNITTGASRAAKPPTLPLGAKTTKFRINVNEDGYQEVDLNQAVGNPQTAPGKVENLDTAENVRNAIKYVVSRLQPKRSLLLTPAQTFSHFDCLIEDGVLVLKSGTSGAASSVTIAPALKPEEDASGLLGLGKLNKGIETFGSAVTRPLVNPRFKGTQVAALYLVKKTPLPDQIDSVQEGSDGDKVNNDNFTIFQNAFKTLDAIDDVSLIAVPGNSLIAGEGMNYCANRPLQDCFFIADIGRGQDSVTDAETFVKTISPRNSYGAVYTPWLKMPDPTGASSEPILVPPSGFVAGLYAKTDAQRGVWKAPAGTNAALSGALRLTANFTDVEQGNLNVKNINVIRQFPASGIVLWGARTLDTLGEWKYIPVRRMMIFLRVSIYRGIQWAVFEPNDETLWSQLRLNITSFMTILFRKGAFQGATPSQAFFVKCDGETTTQGDIDAGTVNVVIGFAPLKPAEFVVVTISQKAGQAS